MTARRAVPLVLLLVVSLAVALIACDLTPHTLHFYNDADATHLAFKVYGPAVAWLLLVVLGFHRYRWHGLWLLSGAPCALLWPYQFTKLAVDCWLRTAPSIACSCWLETASSHMCY